MTPADNKQLDRIEGIVQSNHRALRGHNGDQGLVGEMKNVKGFMEENTKQQAKCAENFSGIAITLHGTGSDKMGVVGEQLMIKRISKWLIGIGTALSLSTLGLLIKLALTPTPIP